MIADNGRNYKTLPHLTEGDEILWGDSQPVADE